MKRKLFLTTIAILGVFLMFDLPILAQSTGRSSEREAARSASRTRTATVVVPAVPDLEHLEVEAFDHGYTYTTSSSEKNSKLSLSKRYEGTTTTKKGTFIVQDGVRKIRLSISGRVESGNIDIELYLPDGKEAGKVSVDDTADVHWSQSIGIDEEESKYYGEWTYVINAKEAYGRYELQLSTY